MPTWTRVFFDDFPAGPDVDRRKWASPFWTQHGNPAFYGRTGIRNPKDFAGPIGLIPCTAENGADLRLSTYNPKAVPANGAFLGSEIFTISGGELRKFGGEGQTVKFEAVVKCPAMPPGGVTSVFAYALTGFQENHNEIDFEFASKHWAPPTTDNAVNLNVYVNSSGGGFGPGPKETTVNFLEWNTFTFIWTQATPQSVEWQINGVSFWKETQNIPDASSAGMRLDLNFWAPARDWAWAFSDGINPTGGPGTEWHYHVKSAAVYYAT